MQLHSVFLAAIMATIPASAFTNGSIVPPYICNPQTDGLPKSFGQLLLFTKEQVKTVAFNQNAGQDIQAPQLQQQGNQQIGNTAYILASFHDSPNNIQSNAQQINVKPANGNTITAGTANKLTFSTANGAQLKGLLAYARDTSNTPQGTFTDAGNVFVKFPGCGTTANGQINGVIQSTGVSANSQYNQLSYQAPACVPGDKITIAGLSVTAKGFGTWTQTFAVTGSTCSGNTGGTSTTGTTSSGTGNGNSNTGGNAASGTTSSNTGNGSGNGNGKTGTGTTSQGSGNGNGNAGGNSTFGTTTSNTGNGSSNGTGKTGTSTTSTKAGTSATAKASGSAGANSAQGGSGVSSNAGNSTSASGGKKSTTSSGSYKPGNNKQNKRAAVFRA